MSVDAFNEKQWKKPGEIWRIRRFLASGRHSVPKACSSCHKNKVKCNGRQPCSQCIKHNIPCDLCEDVQTEQSSSQILATSGQSPMSEATGSALTPSTLESKFLALRNAVLATKLDRPVSFSPNGILFADDVASREERAKQLPHRMLRIAWDSGFAEQDFIECFRHMTPALSAAIDTALSAVETLAFSGQAPPVERERSAQLLVDDISMSLQDSDRVGILQQCWDPVTHRRIAANFNNFMGQLVGSPREVGLTALGRSECRCALTDLRFVCHVLHSLLNFNKDEDVNYLRWAPNCMRGDWDTCILVRMTKRLTRDAANRPHQVRLYYTVVSAEEYDAARRLNPDACEPYVSELPGMPRTARELLAAKNRGELESFQHLQASLEGRQRMDSLAAIILQRFAGVIAAAQAIQGGGGGGGGSPAVTTATLPSPTAVATLPSPTAVATLPSPTAVATPNSTATSDQPSPTSSNGRNGFSGFTSADLSAPGSLTGTPSPRPGPIISSSLGGPRGVCTAASASHCLGVPPALHGAATGASMAVPAPLASTQILLPFPFSSSPTGTGTAQTGPGVQVGAAVSSSGPIQTSMSRWAAANATAAGHCQGAVAAALSVGSLGSGPSTLQVAGVPVHGSGANPLLGQCSLGPLSSVPVAPAQAGAVTVAQWLQQSSAQ